MMSSDSSGWDQVDWNHVVSFLLRQVVYVEGLTAAGTSDKFKAHVLFIFAGPPLEIKKRASSFHLDPPSPTASAKLLV